MRSLQNYKTKIKKIYLRFDIMIMMLLLLNIISNSSSSIVICLTISKKVLGSVLWAFWFGTAGRIIPWWNYDGLVICPGCIPASHLETASIDSCFLTQPYYRLDGCW